MKTTMKKVLSMTLALVLLLGVLPMTALAAEHSHYDLGNNGYCDAQCDGYVESCKNGHTLGTAATCTTRATCSVCGWGISEVDANNHANVSTTWSSDGTYHWKTCTCDAQIDKAEHSGGTATCKDFAICSVCNNSYGAKSSEHLGAADTWLSDASMHWHPCVCGAEGVKYGEAAHIWNPATATAPETCSCGETRGNALGTATISVKVNESGTTTQKDGGSFTMTASTTKSADAIRAEYLSTISTYSAAQILSYVVTDSANEKYAGTRTIELAPNGQYTLWIEVPASTQGGQTGGNTGDGTTGGTTTAQYKVYYNVNVDDASKVNVPLPGKYDAGTSMSVVLRDLGLVNVKFPGLFQDWFYLEGWYLNGVKVTGNETINSDIVLVAKWAQKYNYEVILKLYTNGNTNNVVKVLDVFSYVQDDGKISHSEVTAIAKKYIESNNDAPITVYGPFDANGWERYSLYPNRLTSTEYVEVNPYGTTVVHAMVHNAKIYNGTSSTSKADSTNPKTGDMIMMPAAVLGLSASALAVMFYLKKKRAY